jgi:hypothetical protein
MWYFFDADMQRQLAAIKELTTRRVTGPTREWPVVFIKEDNAFLVIREWANGELTAYLQPRS